MQKRTKRSKARHISNRNHNPGQEKKAVLTKLSYQQKQMIKIQHKMGDLLKLASPRSTNKDVRWTGVDLTALWEVSKKHIQHINLLMKCSHPRDHEKIKDLLTEIQVNFVSQGLEHLDTLKRSLPRVRSNAYRFNPRY